MFYAAARTGWPAALDALEALEAEQACSRHLVLSRDVALERAWKAEADLARTRALLKRMRDEADQAWPYGIAKRKDEALFAEVATELGKDLIK